MFVVPATQLPTVGARIMGLDEPEKKMSKSATGSGHAVSLLDPPEVIRKKILRATTDSHPAVDFETLGAGVRKSADNLPGVHRSARPMKRVRQFEGMRYGDLKKTVAEAVIAGARTDSEALPARSWRSAATSRVCSRTARNASRRSRTRPWRR